jgi:hypothetical protein
MEAVAVAQEKLTLRMDDGGHHDPQISAMSKQIAEELGMNYEEGPIVACPTCQHFACVCGIKATHKPDCPFLRAQVCSVGIECDHGYDVCPTCDPCTCQ